jgi:hypothetical protein
MSLLMSETLPIDPLLDDASSWLNSLSESVNALNAALNDAEEGSADSIEWARLTPALPPWSEMLMACLRR